MRHNNHNLYKGTILKFYPEGNVLQVVSFDRQ